MQSRTRPTGPAPPSSSPTMTPTAGTITSTTSSTALKAPPTLQASATRPPRSRRHRHHSRSGPLRLRSTSTPSGHLSMGQEELRRYHSHRPVLHHPLHRGRLPQQRSYRRRLHRRNRRQPDEHVQLHQHGRTQPQRRPSQPHHRRRYLWKLSWPFIEDSQKQSRLEGRTLPWVRPFFCTPSSISASRSTLVPHPPYRPSTTLSAQRARLHPRRIRPASYADA